MSVGIICMSNYYDSFDEDEGFGWVARALLDWRLNEEGAHLHGRSDGALGKGCVCRGMHSFFSSLMCVLLLLVL